ncbi:MAG: hypothetical protein FJ221_13810 [Lentisphaerae bacterium]|nr:hypothetical protein [Lentisphaerota bacterium]
MRRFLSSVLAVVVAVLAAEGLLRLAFPKQIFFHCDFTNGVHMPDRDYGFRWRPGYEGIMRHPDGVYAPVPLRLNEYAFRLPVASTNAGPGALRVLLLGGRSMMFCFGFPDRETIAGRMADLAPRPLVVQNATSAGIDLYRNWHLAREQILAFKPDVILVSIYKEDPFFLGEFAPEFTRLPPPPGTPEQLFILWDGMVSGRSPLVHRLGRHHDTSYLLYGLCNLQTRYLDARADVVRWFRRHTARAPAPDRPQGMTAFLRHIAASPVTGGAAVGVVLLPQMNKPPDLYAHLVPLLPEEMPVANLHADLIHELSRYPWVADGHYGREGNERIARALLDHALRLDAARKGRPPAAVPPPAP